jgi:hypothetical protein
LIVALTSPTPAAVSASVGTGHGRHAANLSWNAVQWWVRAKTSSTNGPWNVLPFTFTV